MPTKLITRATLAPCATISVHAAHDIEPYDFGDSETENWIRAELASGNMWAWCVVTVTATFDDNEEMRGIAVLGGNSYKSRKDFERNNLAQMTEEALDDLWSQIERQTPAGRARSLADSSYKAITTSFRGPTDSHGSRIIARCEAKRISVECDPALSDSANHAAAALHLMDHLGWSARYDLVMGGTGKGFVFVQIPKRATARSQENHRGHRGICGTVVCRAQEDE